MTVDRRCILCSQSSLQGIEPRTFLFCARQGKPVSTLDHCVAFQNLRQVHGIFKSAVSVEMTPAGREYFGLPAEQEAH